MLAYLFKGQLYSLQDLRKLPELSNLMIPEEPDEKTLLQFGIEPKEIISGEESSAPNIIFTDLEQLREDLIGTIIKENNREYHKIHSEYTKIEIETFHIQQLAATAFLSRMFDNIEDYKTITECKLLIDYYKERYGVENPTLEEMLYFSKNINNKYYEYNKRLFSLLAKYKIKKDKILNATCIKELLDLNTEEIENVNE